MSLTMQPPWFYFDREAEDDALAALRARMGPSFATVPDDSTLTQILTRSVSMFEQATHRWFYPASGVLKVAGTDTPRLFLGPPIVSAEQVDDGGITAIRIDDDDEDIDPTLYVCNDGAGIDDEDPRQNPYVDYRVAETGSAWNKPPNYTGRTAIWPWGVKNVSVTGTFGYVEADGTTPELVLHALARICVMQSGSNDDPGAIFDRRAGGLISETTRDRGYTMAAGAVGGGLTLDREIDMIIARYRRPPQVKISRPRHRKARSRYYL